MVSVSLRECQFVLPLPSVSATRPTSQNTSKFGTSFFNRFLSTESKREISRKSVTVDAAFCARCFGSAPPEPNAPNRTPASKKKEPVFVYEDSVVLNKPVRPTVPEVEDSNGRLGSDPVNHRSGYVALIGKPNAGKSSILNNLLQRKLCIVTNKPQTTRNKIMGIWSEKQHQMIIYDTPGIFKSENQKSKLDEYMMKSLRKALLEADCIVFVIDVSLNAEIVEDYFELNIMHVLKSKPVLFVLNQKDKIKPGELKQKIQMYESQGLAESIICTSAKYGHGMDELKKWMVQKLPLGPSYFPKNIVSDSTERFFVSEIFREKILLLYQKEIPYACQVNVLRFLESHGKDKKDFIELEIVVERDSQKGIMLGKDGNAIKVLSTSARLDIENFLGRPVYLETRVKVKDKWRQDESYIQNTSQFI